MTIGRIAGVRLAARVNLESLRGDPEFKRIVAVANENQKRTARGRPPGPRSHEVRIPIPPSKEP